ncbi:hypothetical protein BS47DRAFT_213174 [Hydnum rufescens UP504]|uniref:Uncharacterized protein n=1 Tax=Hydnum rufescens UP504 TaxID=1448309 RepID=A0A9P6ANF4_9AGAM|nr:hypothetical protein BS47DRAFT_213174 [Hydnum rufescens UP504]
MQCYSARCLTDHRLFQTVSLILMFIDNAKRIAEACFGFNHVQYLQSSTDCRASSSSQVHLSRMPFRGLRIVQTHHHFMPQQSWTDVRPQTPNLVNFDPGPFGSIRTPPFRRFSVSVRIGSCGAPPSRLGTNSGPGLDQLYNLSTMDLEPPYCIGIS